MGAEEEKKIMVFQLLEAMRILVSFFECAPPPMIFPRLEEMHVYGVHAEALIRYSLDETDDDKLLVAEDPVGKTYKIRCLDGAGVHILIKSNKKVDHPTLSQIWEGEGYVEGYNYGRFL